MSVVELGKLGTSISPLLVHLYDSPLVLHCILQLDTADIVLQSRLALPHSPISNMSVISLHQSNTDIAIIFYFLL